MCLRHHSLRSPSLAPCLLSIVGALIAAVVERHVEKTRSVCPIVLLFV